MRPTLYIPEKQTESLYTTEKTRVEGKVISTKR